MRAVQVTLAACLGGFALASGAGAQPVNATVATFADPSPSPVTPMFSYNAAIGVLTGGWTGNNLLLQTPGLNTTPDFANAHFTMTPLNFVANVGGPVMLMSGGTIQFFDQVNAPLLTITFGGAYLTNVVGVGASDFLGFNVTFSGPMVNSFQPITNEAFSFSFGNPVQTGGPGQFGPFSYTVTGSFTSSATLFVPTPGAVALLGFAGLAASRRRRR